jgi:hypothetical protein
MCSLYGWKVVLLLQGYDYDALLQLSKKVKKSAVMSSEKSTKISKSRIEVACRKESTSRKEGASRKDSSRKEVEGEPSAATNDKKYGITNTNPFDAGYNIYEHIHTPIHTVYHSYHFLTPDP